MNKWVICVILLSSALYAELYTLEKAVEIAVAHNQSIKESHETLKNSRSQVRAAYSAVFPKIDFDAKWEWAVEQYNPLEGDNSNPYPSATPFITPGDSATFSQPTAALAYDIGSMMQGLGESMTNDHQTTAGLVLTQTIFNQAAWTAPKIAVEYEKLSEYQHEALMTEVKFMVTQSFYRALYFDKAVDIMMEALSTAQKHLAQVETMHASGLVSEIDYLRAQINVSSLEVDSDAMQQDLVLAKNALLNTMGLSYNKDIALEGKLETPEISFKKESSFDTALKHRRELAQLQQLQKLRDYAITIEQSDYFPTLYVGGAYTLLNIGDKVINDTWHTDVRVFAGIKLNLFNGLSTKERVVQARTELEKVKINTDKARKGIKLQLESEWEKIAEAERQIIIRKKLIELTQKTEGMVSASYEIGEASQLEVLDAELEVRKAKLQYQEALLAYTLASIGLKQAMGIF
ncbi:MAG: TolC family protein [Fibrobacterales bacterium]